MYPPNVPTAESVMLPVSFTVVPTSDNDRPVGIIFVNVRRESPFFSRTCIPNARHECEAMAYIDITVQYTFSLIPNRLKSQQLVVLTLFHKIVDHLKRLNLGIQSQ
jgi:hypothetical protein